MESIMENRDTSVPCVMKTFKETTGSVLGKIHKKELFLKFQDAMTNENYAPIVDITSSFNVSIPTAFD